MNNRKIITFIVIAYGISWAIWTPNVIAHNYNVSWGVSNWLHIAGGLGPFLSAVLTTFIYGKGDGLVKFLSEKLFTVPKFNWILVGVGMPVAFFLIAALILGLFSGELVALADLGINSKLPITSPPLIWLLWCFFYGLGEEGGWRGFLFPEMVKGYPARISTLYVAFVWAPWHLPVFFYDKDLGSMGMFETVGWLVGLVFGSLLLGWLVKNARYNLWPVILWHGTFNFFTVSERINPLFPGLMSAMVIITVLWIARRYGQELELEPN